MHRPLTAAAIVAFASIAHAQTGTAKPQFAVNATIIPADHLPLHAPRGGPHPGPVSTAFTYQGYLENAGASANAAFDMRFTLLDNLDNIVAGPICIDNVAVSAGIFSVQLDFGAQFDGRALRLAIAVRPGGPVGDCATGAYTPLTPAQPLTATPYALGLRLPFHGVDAAEWESAFMITKQDQSAGSSSILAVSGNRAVFPFGDGAGVRGEATGGANAGVLGITDNYVGVIGYGLGNAATGVFGRTDGNNSIAIQGFATASNSWAGYFEGRTYFSTNVGIGTTSPQTALHVAGTTRTNAIRITDNAGAGRILKSNAQGDGIWTPTGSNFIAGPLPPSPGVTTTTDFVSSTTSITVIEGQRVLITASQSFGSLVVGGGTNLDLWIGYRVSGGALTTVGGGVFGLTVPQGQRQLYTLSAVVALPAGTYDVGLAGRSANPGSWNNNEWGYVTAVILP